MRARPTALTAACVGLALLLGGCANSGTNGSASQTTAFPTASASNSTTSSASAADVAFAQLMIPHHEQAIQMAELAGTNAKSQALKTLAAQIKAQQAPEITTMTGWLTTWGAPTVMPSTPGSSSGSTGHDGMSMGGMSAGGLMSEAQMSALSQTKGRAFDSMWLQLMITHHQGGIAMAKTVLATTKNPDVRALAQAIINGQQAEITKMRGML